MIEVDIEKQVIYRDDESALEVLNHCKQLWCDALAVHKFPFIVIVPPEGSDELQSFYLDLDWKMVDHSKKGHPLYET